MSWKHRRSPRQQQQQQYLQAPLLHHSSSSRPAWLWWCPNSSSSRSGVLQHWQGHRGVQGCLWVKAYCPHHPHPQQQQQQQVPVEAAPRGPLHSIRCTPMLLPPTPSTQQQQQQGPLGCLLCLQVWWGPTPIWDHTPGCQV
jgi:hypothetical protein